MHTACETRRMNPQKDQQRGSLDVGQRNLIRQFNYSNRTEIVKERNKVSNLHPFQTL